MKFNEALYFAFVIGHRGSVSRNNWQLYPEYKYQSIDLTCHPSDENDYKDYLHISNKPFCYTVLDDKLKNNIQLALRNSRYAQNKYGLPITDEDLKAEDWVVNGLMYIGTRF